MSGTEINGPFRHVNHGWDDNAVKGMSPVERLVYRSNLLGDDQRITNTGGGNTSSKAMETDPLTGEQTEVLWVKGSGGDLRTSKAANFSSLYQQKLTSRTPPSTSTPAPARSTRRCTGSCPPST